MFAPTHFPIRIISHPKLSGFGEHWGEVQLPNDNAAHLTHTGEKIVCFNDFAQGRPLKEVRPATSRAHFLTVTNNPARSR